MTFLDIGLLPQLQHPPSPCLLQKCELQRSGVPQDSS
jgi:hypothetical protein